MTKYVDRATLERLIKHLGIRVPEHYVIGGVFTFFIGIQMIRTRCGSSTRKQVYVGDTRRPERRRGSHFFDYYSEKVTYCLNDYIGPVNCAFVYLFEDYIKEIAYIVVVSHLVVEGANYFFEILIYYFNSFVVVGIVHFVIYHYPNEINLFVTSGTMLMKRYVELIGENYVFMIMIYYILFPESHFLYELGLVIVIVDVTIEILKDHYQRSQSLKGPKEPLRPSRINKTKLRNINFIVMILLLAQIRLSEQFRLPLKGFREKNFEVDFDSDFVARMDTRFGATTGGITTGAVENVHFVVQEPEKEDYTKIPPNMLHHYEGVDEHTRVLFADKADGSLALTTEMWGKKEPKMTKMSKLAIVKDDELFRQ